MDSTTSSESEQDVIQKEEARLRRAFERMGPRKPTKKFEPVPQPQAPKKTDPPANTTTTKYTPATAQKSQSFSDKITVAKKTENPPVVAAPIVKASVTTSAEVVDHSGHFAPQPIKKTQEAQKFKFPSVAEIRNAFAHMSSVPTSPPPPIKSQPKADVVSPSTQTKPTMRPYASESNIKRPTSTNPVHPVTAVAPEPPKSNSSCC